MKVLVSTKTNTGPKGRLCLHQLLLILLAQQISYYEMILFLILLSPQWVLEISSTAKFSVIHLRHPFCFEVFRFQVSKAHSIFYNMYHQRHVFVFKFIKHWSLFSDIK
jgi:hypothetical protein